MTYAIIGGIVVVAAIIYRVIYNYDIIFEETDDDEE